MKRIIGYITVAATICAIAVSCSGINKIIKSGDPEFAYRQAVELYDAGKSVSYTHLTLPTTSRV